jgi:hypothetical protein
MSWVDSAVNAELVQRFDAFAISSGRSTNEVLANEQPFIIDRLKYDLTLAVRGDTEANRFLLLADEPVLSALSQFPRARELALASRKIK